MLMGMVFGKEVGCGNEGFGVIEKQNYDQIES